MIQCHLENVFRLDTDWRPRRPRLHGQEVGVDIWHVIGREILRLQSSFFRLPTQRFKACTPYSTERMERRRFLGLDGWSRILCVDLIVPDKAAIW